jgi:hypothetical protein
MKNDNDRTEIMVRSMKERFHIFPRRSINKWRYASPPAKAKTMPDIPIQTPAPLIPKR